MRKVIRRWYRTVAGAFSHWIQFLGLLFWALLTFVEPIYGIWERDPMITPLGWPLWIWGIWFALFWVIGTLFVRLVKLEREKEPKFNLQYEEKPPFVITDPLRTVEPGIRLIRIRIKNEGVENLNNCLVVLESLTDKDGNEGFFTPIGLITQHQRMQNRRGGVFNLRPDQFKYIDVAYLDERKDDSEIMLQYETVTSNIQYANTLKREYGPFKLRIGAYGAGQPIKKEFTMWVDGGRLRMIEKGKKNGTR